MRRRNNPEIIAGRINADLSIAAGEGFTVSGSGGAIVITLRPGFRLISATAAIAQSSVNSALLVDMWTDRSFRIFSYTISTSAIGSYAVSFVAVGVQQ